VVGAIAQELIDEVTVGRVDLDPVEAGLNGALSGDPILIDEARDLVEREGARRDERFESRVRVGLTRRPA